MWEDTFRGRTELGKGGLSSLPKGGRGPTSSWMRSHRIRKRALASPGGCNNDGVMLPLTFGRGRTVASDGFLDSGLSIRAIAATVIQRSLDD
ncbi:hypothetical protein AVEN_115222-1 [Araneus ventricosus]|uniref:Uncharacterized protein n=1 Tax=Araneus ventricosus TaxID=182803 RepID=A0A4Y1ZXQ9_ARAVE|nr:hypothetical protein AVEN_115222-1 [Araneus ventricosus]